MASSPISPAFPTMPPKEKANMHPYAIKTSSSAVLTRSNSTGNKSATSHHYTPPVPISPKTAKIRYVPRKHAFPSPSKDIPPPVPMPPSMSGFISDGEGVPPTPPLTVRVRRRESMPFMPPTHSDLESVLDDLPPNPKLWTPAQLATYLSSSLRLKGGARPPILVSHDISTFVIKNHLNGRVFLRMKRQDYEHFDLNPLWKDALFDASRTLRQSSVHDRIMGTLTSASLSVDDLTHLGDESEDESDHGDDNIPPPPYPRLASNWQTNGNKKRTIGRASLRPGRVRGMVQSFERSASGSEASASGSENDESERFVITQEFVAEPEGLPVSLELTSSEDSATSFPSMEHEVTTSSQVTSPEDISVALNPPNLEPSIEELLKVEPEANSEIHRYPSWGARAWEEELASSHLAHVTAKKIPLTEAQTDTMYKARDTQEPVALAELFQDITIAQATASSALEETPIIEAALSSKRGVSVNTADDVEAWRKEVSIGTEIPPLPTRREMSVGTEGIIKGPPSVPDLSPDVYAILRAFQERLDHVEKRLDELEKREAIQQAMPTSEQEIQVEEEEEEEEEETEEEITLPTEGKTSHSAAQEETQSAPPVVPVHDRNYAAPEPATLGGLPGYVLLISVGVVAMTMRVVLARMLGGRRR